MQSYDYLVIGGGSGGLASARRAASYGVRVAVIEQHRLGGVCVNAGCVPKKVMFNAAVVADHLHDAAGYGFELGEHRFDWARLKRGRDAYVARLNGIYEGNLARESVEHIQGRARFLDAHTLEVGDRRVGAPHVLIATGSRACVPDVPGVELGITSDGFFELERQPRRVAVVGGGYIGVELAGIFSALGSEVMLFMRHDRPLRHFDELVGETLMSEMQKGKITVLPRAEVSAVEREASGSLRVMSSGSPPLAGFDSVIWAIGRVPNSQDLGLEKAGVEVDLDCNVVVDAWQNASVAGVYAVGDVAGRWMLTPVAIAAGRSLSDRLFGGDATARLDYELIPSVVFSHPPVASVGLSEAEAQARHGSAGVRVYLSRFTNLYHAVTERRTASAMKLVVTGAEERVVGIHVVGIGADELIQGFAVALRMGARKRDLDRTVAIHPTAAEELVTMR